MKLLLAAAALALAAAAHAQEPQLATFQESAQVLVDRAVTGEVTASITLQTTSGQEVLVPPELAAAVSGDGRVLSVVLTNKDGCGVLGVEELACILVNTARSPADGGISGIREAARASADRLAGGLNDLFGTEARFHSVYIHPEGGLDGLLGTSGAVSGGGVVSAVYGMPQERTSAMYERITAKLLSPEIRGAGGFYDAARTMSFLEGSHAAVSLIPRESGLLYQVRLAVSHPGSAPADRVDLLEYAGVDTMYRSRHFDGGSFPLNSVVQAVVLSAEPVSLEPEAALLPVVEVGGDVLPADLSSPGWVVDSSDPGRQEAYYLFGGERSVSGSDLAVRIVPEGREAGPDAGDLLVPGAIAAAAVAAALFYLRGSKK